MSNRKRIVLPNSLYYVISRNNHGETCFFDDHDRAKFFKYVGKYCTLLDFKVNTLCLMQHEFHLLLESGPAPLLSEFMRRLLTAYTVYFNRYRGRHGRLFKGPFKSFIVDKSKHLASISRHIHLLPARESGIEFAEQFPGSSLRHYIHGYEPFFLETGDILNLFKNSRKKYAKFVKKGLNQPADFKVRENAFIGEDEFVRRIKNQIRPAKSDAELEEIEKDLMQKVQAIANETAKYFHISPDEIIKSKWAHGSGGNARSVLIILLRRNTDFSHARIAEFLQLEEKNGISYHLSKFHKNEQIKKSVLKIEVNMLS